MSLYCRASLLPYLSNGVLLELQLISCLQFEMVQNALAVPDLVRYSFLLVVLKVPSEGYLVGFL